MEKIIQPMSGFVALLLALVSLAIGVFLFVTAGETPNPLNIVVLVNQLGVSQRVGDQFQVEMALNGRQDGRRIAVDDIPGTQDEASHDARH